MDEFKQIKKSSLLILLLQFAGTAIGQGLLYLSVRAGDEATLPCNSVRHDQGECNGTTWFFSGSAVELVKGGQISNHAKSDRLRLTDKCSLVVKKVTEEDVGSYFCRQYNKANQQQQLGSDSQVYVSVVTMTEHQDNDEVTLRCSVTTYGGCEHTVKWLLQGPDVDKENREIKTSQSPCSASVTFLTSLFSYASRSELFTCEVTADGNVQTFRPRSSAATPTTPTTTTTTTTAVKSSLTINNPGWWLYLVVALVLVALLITIVAFITWRKMKGKEARESDSVGQTSTPAVNSPETNSATADPEEGVCYASISYTKNTHKQAEVKIETDADEGDEVTYSTVKASTN